MTLPNNGAVRAGTIARVSPRQSLYGFRTLFPNYPDTLTSRWGGYVGKGEGRTTVSSSGCFVRSGRMRRQERQGVMPLPPSALRPREDAPSFYASACASIIIVFPSGPPYHRSRAAVKSGPPPASLNSVRDDRSFNASTGPKTSSILVPVKSWNAATHWTSRRPRSGCSR